MDIEKFSNIVWCNLEIVVLKIYSNKEWDTKKVLICKDNPDLLNEIPVVNIYICDENDPIFEAKKTYRERIMSQGIYLGHNFGVPAMLNCIDDYNIALYHPDPGKIIWCYITKCVLLRFAYERGILYLKGGAIEYRNKGFLVLGRGGSGKTEMINKLCKNGAKFIANTHLLVNKNCVRGIKSNIRVRQDGKDLFVSIKELHGSNIYDKQVPIGGIFWVNYNKKGDIVINKLDSTVAFNNIQYFASAIINWEMKEDVADYYKSDPIKFSEHIACVDEALKSLCDSNSVYYLNLDINSKVGLSKAIQLMNELCEVD